MFSVVPLVQLWYLCLVVQGHVFSCATSSVVLLIFGGSGSLVFSYATSSVVILMFSGSEPLVLFHQFSCVTGVSFV